MKTNIVIIKTSEVGNGSWTFDNALHAALFMWGKDFNDYEIYVRVNAPPRDIEKLKEQLIGMVSLAS